MLLQKFWVFYITLWSANIQIHGELQLWRSSTSLLLLTILVTFLDPLVQLYVMALNSMTDSQGTTPNMSSPSASHHFQMHADDVIQIIEGLGHVTTALPVEQADPVLSALLAQFRCF